MPRLLLATFDQDGIPYVSFAQRLGMSVQVLDCFEDVRRRLKKVYGNLLLHAPGHRTEVAKTVAESRFDVGVIHEHASDFVRSALITQSFRESGLRYIVVVTRDPKRAAMYRRCGAHRVVVAKSADEAWRQIESSLVSFASA